MSTDVTETTETTEATEVVAAPVKRELPRLKKKYREQIVPALNEEFKYANPMQVPGLV